MRRRTFYRGGEFNAQHAFYDEQEGYDKSCSRRHLQGKSWAAPRVYRRLHPGGGKNGGQYTHGAVWDCVQACCCKLGMGEKVFALFGRAESHKPRAHAGAGGKNTRGSHMPWRGTGWFRTQCRTGGLTWYTGPQRGCISDMLPDMLGIRREKDALRIAPTVPFEEYTANTDTAKQYTYCT